MSNKTVSSGSSGGVGFAGLLTIVLIALKLTGYIDWDWVWVVAPLWISCIAFGVIFAAAFVLLFIVALLKD